MGCSHGVGHARIAATLSGLKEIKIDTRQRWQRVE